MLEAQQLAARRGAVTLFSGVDFKVAQGEALIVTGANGSGKTTLLRIVAGLTQSSAGTLQWRSSLVTPFSPALRSATLYVGHAAALKDELSAEENLAALTSLHDANVDRGLVRDALAQWSLGPQQSLPTRVLSQGQRRRIGLARLGLLSRPIWVLDEPTTALDAAGIALLQQKLGEHLNGGGLALIATHQAFTLPASAMRALRLQ